VLGIVYWLLRERDDRMESSDAHDCIGAREHKDPDSPA